MRRYLVTYGTRLDVLEADDEEGALIAWIERHRPDWWGVPLWEGGPRSCGFAFDPYLDLRVRPATPADLERLDAIVADTRQYLGKSGKGWR